MKITLAMVEEAERLLAAGELSQRKIAALVGMSRASVGNIANGRRPHRLHHVVETFVPCSGPLQRCPGCGGMVHVPCLLCHIRAMKTREREHAREQRRAARVAPFCPRTVAA
jgi:hypothetical protein